MPKEKNYFRLFDDNPPKEDNYIRELFIDREDELAHGKKMLLSDTDFPGILAVHGATRCGKSHLVSRLLVVEEIQKKFDILKINATTYPTVRNIFEDIFFKLKSKIEFIASKKKIEGITKESIEAILLYLNEIKPLIKNENTEITCSKTREKVESIGNDAKFIFSFLQIGSSIKTEFKDISGIEWTRAGFDEKAIVELLIKEADLLCRITNKKILLFVDDLDLVDNPYSGDQINADQILNLLQPLGFSSYFLVLITTRTAYFKGKQKNIKNFLRIRPMFSDYIEDIYKLRINSFNNGEKIFSDEALELLVTSADGLVGIFFSNCYKILSAYPLEDGLIEKEHIKKYVKMDIEGLMNNPDYFEIMNKIFEAVRKNTLELSIHGLLGEDDIIYDVLTPILNQKDRYRITKMYALTIPEILEETG